MVVKMTMDVMLEKKNTDIFKTRNCCEGLTWPVDKHDLLGAAVKAREVTEPLAGMQYERSTFGQRSTSSTTFQDHVRAQWTSCVHMHIMIVRYDKIKYSVLRHSLVQTVKKCISLNFLSSPFVRIK